MRITDGRHHFYQWDLNQRVAADGLAVGDEVHFTNAQQQTALVVKAYAMEDGLIVVDVPNVLLRDAYPLIAYRYLKRGDSESTRDEKTWQVKKRPQPSDYVYIETEVQDIMALTEGMREAVAQIGQFTTEQDGRVAELHKADAALRSALESRMDNADAAIRSELSGKAGAPEVAELVERVAALEQNGGGGGGAVSVNITDSTSAYIKTVPKNALPVAAITEIGSASERFENPYDPNALKRYAGEYHIDDDYTITNAVITEDGKIEVVADYYYGGEVLLPITFRELFPDAVIGREYSLKFNAEYSAWNAYDGGISLESYGYLSNFVLTADMLDCKFYAAPGFYSETTWCDPETGEEWWEDRYCDVTLSDFELVPAGRANGQTYDTKVTSVAVQGVNLLPFTPGEQVVAGVTVTIDERGVITLNGTCTPSYGGTVAMGFITLDTNQWYTLRDFAEGEWPTSGKRVYVGSAVSIGNDGSLAAAMGCASLVLANTVRYDIPLKGGFTYNNCKLAPMLVKGIEPPKEYIPHSYRRYSIPEEVQALPAYGLGAIFYPMFYNRIVFRDGRAIYEQRVDTYHNPLSPYVETDITDVLGWDGFIDVEGGGTITFENQYSDHVPSTVIYQQD